MYLIQVHNNQNTIPLHNQLKSNSATTTLQKVCQVLNLIKMKKKLTFRPNQVHSKSRTLPQLTIKMYNNLQIKK